MSAQVQQLDPDRTVHSVLERAREVATSKGHTMGPWRFEDAPPREFVMASYCTACNAVLRVEVSETEFPDVFPLPTIDEYSAAFRYRCLNPR